MYGPNKQVQPSVALRPNKPGRRKYQRASKPAVHVPDICDAAQKHARTATGGTKHYHERVQLDVDSDKQWVVVADARCCGDRRGPG